MLKPLHIVCPHCHTTNRVQPTQLDASPNCGSCKRMLFTGHPVALDDATFDKHISRSEIPVLVDFWAEWCGPCKAMAPGYEQAAVRLEPHMRVAKVDTEKAQALAQRYRIRSIPTLMLFVDGVEVSRQAGAMTSTSQIVQWARHYAGRMPQFT